MASITKIGSSWRVLIRRREHKPLCKTFRNKAQAEVWARQREADIVRFAMATTMRRGEIIQLRWDDLDAAKRLILVRDRDDPRKKQGNDQWVPLLGDAWELVQRQPKEGERIFPVHAQALSKVFKAACDGLGIPDLHFHDLRHEGTSRLFEQGYEIQQVSLATSRKNWSHLRRYSSLKPEDLHRLKDPGKLDDEAAPDRGSQNFLRLYGSWFTGLEEMPAHAPYC